ncbi:hypothetical protein GGI15_000556 [Coemansia interrupta]|uniref:Uncharacterized protein n=1 Tax=Coemansia interrupta TaxID=1126814 RepID=A0A9W8LPS0_9FUNG|nr:hypothetical protein GGI15_000556 [Coemansia interrupta]
MDLIHREYDKLQALLGNMSIAAGTLTLYVALGFFPQLAQTAYLTLTEDSAEPVPFAGMSGGIPGNSGEVPSKQKNLSQR